MELRRRDAIGALAAIGAGGSAALFLKRSEDGEADGPGGDRVHSVMIAVAEVVYPTSVLGIEPFVETFLAGRLDRADHAAELRETVETLDDLAREWHGTGVAKLERASREELLQEVGADTAAEDPDGTTAERVRYYVINELLLALYASPKGGELVGLENPQGHPGGTDTYQMGPQ